mmetsp:Transcript_95913/g.213409  ORF Transcript_95913/g.213409 Transcript_95913/m.213409 type:complete len:281 (+) Transcript_95913:69-911(+)
MQLVAAIRGCGGGPLDGPLELAELRLTLDREASAAGRNRLLRRWLTSRRDAVANNWVALAFPAPPPGSSVEKVPARRPLPPRLSDAAVCAAATPAAVPEQVLPRPPLVTDAPSIAGCTGVAVFDFDQTLTTRHVGVFEDLSQALERSFGGRARVEMLYAMLAQLRDRGCAVSVVTRNSRHVVSRALSEAGLMPLVTSALIFGFEDYEDEVVKSTVILGRVLPALDLPEEAMIFVDDDPTNIKDVAGRCPRATVLQAPRQGLGVDECAKVAAWAVSALPPV